MAISESTSPPAAKPSQAHAKRLALQIMKDDGTHLSTPYLHDVENGYRKPQSDQII
jgi:hypothetical protein